MKKKTQVEEQEKEDRQDTEQENQKKALEQEQEQENQKKALEVSRQDQVNLNMDGYYRQQLLAFLERMESEKSFLNLNLLRIAEALEGLKDFVESSEESGEKEELEVPEPSND